MHKFVTIKDGLEIVDQIGQIELAVDRVTQERVLVIDTRTPAGKFPLKMDHDQYLALGIAIIRESGCKYDFREREINTNLVSPDDLVLDDEQTNTEFINKNQAELKEWFSDNFPPNRDGRPKEG